jgi:hypothetical protein
MAMELTLEQLKEVARSHWKKHLPNFYLNLRRLRFGEESGECGKVHS